MTSKYTFSAVIFYLSVSLFIPLFIILSGSPLFAEENKPDKQTETPVEKPAEKATAASEDPGLPFLEQALEEKLKATDVRDLGRVIALAQRARKEGLTKQNLQFCDELIASEQLHRGLTISEPLTEKPPEQLGANWQIIRNRTLNDLESAVKVLKDQPLALLRIVQLNLLPEGNAKRAAEVLAQLEPLAKNDPEVFPQVQLLKLMTEKDPAKREKIIEDAVKENPNPRLLFLLAKSQIGQKEFEKAAKTLKKVLELEPDSVQALFGLYEILNETGENEEALKVLSMLEDNAPNPRWGFEKARLLNTLGKNKEAVEVLNQLREGNPNDPAVLGLRAAVYLEMKDYENAQKDADAALRLIPGEAKTKLPIYVLKTQILSAQKKTDEAIQFLEEQINDYPDSKELAVLLVQLYTGKKQYDKAGSLIKKLTAENPDNDSFILLQAGLLAEQKKIDEAIALLKSQRDKKPDDERWIVLSAQFLLEQKRTDEAVKITEDFLAKHNDAVRIKLVLVSLLSEQKKSKEALKILNEIIEQKEKDKQETLALLRMKGNLLLNVNRHSDAAATFEEVLKREPDDEVTLNNLSWLLSTSPVDLVRNGKRALELAEKACKLTQYKKSYILSTLAAAYAELGDFDEAVKWSQKSIDFSQEDENVKDRVEDLKKELESYKKKKAFREVLDEK
ncbi:hypothetical protein FACS189427_03860 [Planctomycetales bacterium]|nr:hypothetical protein FACS189427_03860 [Planctomycetales bacterium]